MKTVIDAVVPTVMIIMSYRKDAPAMRMRLSLNHKNSINRFTGTIFRFYTTKIFTYFMSKASDSTYFTTEVFDLL